MNQQPDFWRTEVFHPLSVHFPIALLIVATIFILISFFSHKKLWEDSGSILLVLGTISAWISIYTGNLADGIVSRKLCDPTVLKAHENMAYYTTWAYTAASVLVISGYLSYRIKQLRLTKIFLLILMLTGSYFLIETGHKGASVVYQQAGGVYVPSSDCAEFE